MASLDMDNANGAQGKPLTGRAVLLWLTAFFGTMLIANGIFLYFALTTFSGLDDPSSYKAGRNYSSEISAAQAQAVRGWSVKADISRSGTGANIDLLAQDHSAAPIGNVTFSLVLGHPADKQHDITAPLTMADIGHYRGRIEEAAPGWWTVTIIGIRDGETVYKSVERIRLP